ncbi:D-alanyl-D-alanine carboxypeptidase [Streptomyces chromofuscus]|uniref:serine-type D-Ala-D-Ala carboxypeptidase n=1 Tax=Streptomyces chromofuscus TaxID=42881 RepID=A0A7M2TEU5_STRCW|nr:D-alanyl-D-alanine carboxypeptidase [Streptomyces chromofuscus]QOV47230.1 D-alanyl-D-alanine carboxypeptidase [Streptomyces chromofuscus]GGT24338.1 D-alanyl-D-alanine carboxypeptidase [Streptomyces chromofuscus]
MEEASVAGESPDRSKQRESSAEPTSGSASPVPEARSAAAPRDPRLAVARESGDGRPADTATRVLSVRERAKQPDGAADTEVAGEETERAAGEAASEGPAGREEREAAEQAAADAETDEAGPMGDERLRAAVAAWVTSADGKGRGARGTQGAEGTTADSAGGSGEEDAVEEAPESASTEKPDAEGESAATRADEGAEEGRTGTGSGTADEAEAARGDATTPVAEAGGDDASGGRDTDATAEDTHTAAQDARPDARDDDEGADGADAGDRSRGEAQDAPDASRGDTKGDVKDGGTQDAEDAAKPAADAAEPAADDDAQDDAEPGTADAAEHDAGNAEPGAGDDDEPGAGAPPVDQPTAVFRAVKPARPAVDQPTTMLKLGDVKRPAPAPESDAERTSRFVALKPLDDPSTRRHPRAAEATTAPPKVPADRTGAPPANATTALPKVPADQQTAAVPQIGPERTTQQPLPPKPPLDLLAELTNTPPPPETPLRTAVRRVKIWTPLVLLLAIVFAIVQAVRPLPTPTLELTAEESYTFEGDEVSLPWPNEGQGAMDVTGVGTMGGFGEQKPVAIGSVAKAMTAYIILKEHPLKAGEEGPQIEVDATAETEGGYDQQGESTLNTVKKGDKLTERQAIAAIMIPSANNIARLVARWDAGSEEAFVKKMNDTAKELGMTNTTYTDPSGLKETTVSTAEDQVKLGNELVKIPALVEITKLPEWVDPSGQKWRNWNTLVPYDGAIGIKTGTTSAAGGNLLFAATKEVGGETVTVVGAILGQHTAPIIDTVNAVSKTAMLGAQEALTPAKILKKGDVVGYVDDRLGGRTPVVVTQDVTAVGWAGLKVELSFVSDEVPHTAKAGTKVGTLTVGDGSGGAVDVPVALQSDLVEPAFTDRLTRVA